MSDSSYMPLATDPTRHAEVDRSQTDLEPTAFNSAKSNLSFSSRHQSTKDFHLKENPAFFDKQELSGSVSEQIEKLFDRFEQMEFANAEAAELIREAADDTTAKDALRGLETMLSNLIVQNQEMVDQVRNFGTREDAQDSVQVDTNSQIARIGDDLSTLYETVQKLDDQIAAQQGILERLDHRLSEVATDQRSAQDTDETSQTLQIILERLDALDIATPSAEDLVRAITKAILQSDLIAEAADQTSPAVSGDEIAAAVARALDDGLQPIAQQVAGLLSNLEGMKAEPSDTEATGDHLDGEILPAVDGRDIAPPIEAILGRVDDISHDLKLRYSDFEERLVTLLQAPSARSMQQDGKLVSAVATLAEANRTLARSAQEISPEILDLHQDFLQDLRSALADFITQKMLEATSDAKSASAK